MEYCVSHREKTLAKLPHNMYAATKSRICGSIGRGGLLLSVSLVAGLLALNLPAAVTNECYVAAGETKSVGDFDYSFADGDCLKKTGPGTLTAIDNKVLKINLIIAEGVYSVPANCYQFGPATLTVGKGASLNCVSPKADTFRGDWLVYIAGSGTGEGDNLGALCIGGNLMDAIFGQSTRFYLDDDAVIYTYGKMNAVFSGGGKEWGPTLNMNRHTLTLRGKDASSVFRPRWRWNIEQPGTIIVQNGEFARQDTVNNFSEDIPLIKVTGNGKLAAYSDGKIWSKVAAFDFEYGTSLDKGNGSLATDTLTIKKLIGPAKVPTTILTVSEELVVRGTDLVEGHCLTVANALTIGENCVFSIVNWGGMSVAPGTQYVVARSDTGITGTPVLDEVAGSLYTIENTGKELVLTAKATNLEPELLEGEENAAHNTEVISKLMVADGSVYSFPEGDYYFSDNTIDFSAMTAKDVVLCASGDKKCVLHAMMKIGAAKNLTVRSLGFSGLETPAIVAEGTAGLTVDSCTLTAVKGSYSELGAFPYALTGVTDFKLVAPVYTVDADGAESTLWDAQAYFDGGTQTADSLARAGEVVLDTPNGVINNNWWVINYIHTLSHLKESAYSGKIVRKRNGGALDMEGTIDFNSLGVAGLKIDEGQFVTRSANHIGIDNAPVHVSPGGVFTIAGTARNHKISFSGSGFSIEYPAVRFTGSAAWNKTEYMTYELEDDAAMYNNCSGENGTFLRSTMYMNGHTLTLRGISGANYRIGRSCKWHGGGMMIVDGVTLSITTRDLMVTDVSEYQIKEGAMPKFIFRNKAQFKPDNDDFTTMIKDVDFADGTSIGLKSGVDGFNIAFDSLTGNPAITSAIPKLTIREKYAARVADFTLGKAFMLDENTKLEFSDDVSVSLVAEKLEKPTANYTLISAPGGIIGNKPRLDEAAREAGWRLLMNSERTELVIGRRTGLTLMYR